MFKKKKELILDDYYEDDTLYSYENADYEDDYEIETTKEEKLKDAVSILSTLSKWFRIFGVFVAVILILYFLIKGKFLTMLLYVIGLIVAFFFGYFFMYLLDFFVSRN